MPQANITNIRLAKVKSCHYFIDANVWLYALQGDTLLQNWQKRYSDFFYSIVDSTLDPQPRILMPTLLFSEVLNAYLKQIALPEYKHLNGISNNQPFIYKKDYRSTQHYKDNYEKVCDDILSLKSSVNFIDDNSLINQPPDFIKPDIEPLDFNDFFYYLLCKEYQKNHRTVIVTNDGDFKIDDIPIITGHQELLAL